MIKKLELLDSILSDPELQAIEYERCRRDPVYFLFTWCQTLDQHDSEQPVKFFPEKNYLKMIAETWFREPLLLIAKSRQMMISWLICALYLWDAMFYEGRFIFFQSKKEQDANALLDRSKFIYEHLPVFLKRKQAISTYCLLEFPENNSLIRAVPEGPDVLRMHTASGVFMDEMAFMESSAAAYQAAQPTIQGGGRFTGVSSANPGFFQTLVEDR